MGSGAATGFLKFTGHERDFNSSSATNHLDYMRARYYSPYLGRFLSPDRVLGSVEVPQSWNRYAYVRNNPLKFRDPDGEALLLATAALGALEGAAFQVAVNAISGEPLTAGVAQEAALGGALGATGIGLANVGRKGFQAFRAARLARAIKSGKLIRGNFGTVAREL